MSKIHRVPKLTYDSLLSELMWKKRNIDNIVFYISTAIENDNQIFWRL